MNLFLLSGSALRLSVWLTKIFGFLTPHGDQERPPALRAKQRKVFQDGILPDLRPRLSAADRAEDPVRIQKAHDASSALLLTSSIIA